MAGAPRGGGGGNWGAVSVNQSGRVLPAQATIHVVLHMSDGGEASSLELSLTLVGRLGRSEPISLANLKSTSPVGAPPAGAAEAQI